MFFSYFTYVQQVWTLICPLAVLVTVDALAHLTYQGYACDRQLCSTLSNNYNDCM